MGDDTRDSTSPHDPPEGEAPLPPPLPAHRLHLVAQRRLDAVVTDAEKIRRLVGQLEAAGSLIEQLQRERDQAVEARKRAEATLRHADSYIDWQYNNERRAA